MPRQTPSQTLGPFFAYALTPEEYGRQGIASNILVDPHTAGERIHVVGRVLDGAGAPVGDAMIEIWQANAAGRYNHPADDRDGQPDSEIDPYFNGFGRCGTDDDGCFDFVTIKPGSHGDDDAPHINVCVSARTLTSFAALSAASWAHRGQFRSGETRGTGWGGRPHPRVDSGAFVVISECACSSTAEPWLGRANRGGPGGGGRRDAVAGAGLVGRAERHDGA